MYNAKYYGKNNAKYYSLVIENANNRKMSIIIGLRKALENKDFELFYQITESVAIDNFDDTISKLNQIRSTGVKVALDDFGTGYSSLNYLRQFPIDALKIDRTFINEVMINSQTAAIVKSIISIAHSLNLPVIAEGVETEEQFNFLYDLHCDFLQGYLISPPVPLEKIEEILMKNTSPK
jgi:diguanylate cyclase